MRLKRLLAPLLLWASMAALLWMVLDRTRAALIDGRAQWAEGELEELLDRASFWSEFDEAAREIEVPFEDWPSFATFLTAYVQAIRERPNSAAISARLALLGEEPPTEPALAPERALRLILEETPEDFHERLEQLAAIHWGALEDYEDEASPALTLPAVISWLEDDDRLIEDWEFCFAALDGTGKVMLSNLSGPVPDTDGPALLARQPFEDDETGHPCVAVPRTLAGNARVILGVEAPAALPVLQQLRGAALASAGMVGALALAFFWALEKRRDARLAALGEACRQAGDGDYGVRLPVTGKGAVDDVAREINRVLERTQNLVDSLQSMSANIAHDLRTPLTRLRGQIDLLLRSPGPDPNLVAAVQAEADQLLDTFSALLRIGQVESGSLRGGFRNFDLAALLRDAAELYEPALEENGLELEATIPPAPAIVHGDLDLWMQSVANLMDNALKYVPAPGQIRLTLVRDGRAWRMTFRDSGPGIPELELDRVLDRFYRLPKHRGQQGNGLGLSLIAAVCNLHNATLALSNDNGLVVDIRWPEPAGDLPSPGHQGSVLPS
ncbi:MAG: HAMP domain-containing sensor histidine kinase [Pseudomonadota bacterium]